MLAFKCGWGGAEISGFSVFDTLFEIPTLAPRRNYRRLYLQNYRGLELKATQKVLLSG